MLNKKDKKIKKDFSKNERHFGVVLERVDTKTDLLIEGQTALNKKIDDFKKDVDLRFGEVDYKFEVVLDELGVIRNELKEKVGRDEFMFLEKRVRALEKSRK